MVGLNKDEERLIERLGAEGKATPLHSGEIGAARELEKADLVFLVRDGSGGAVIRRVLILVLRRP